MVPPEILPHSAYVWQRNWNEAVRDAVLEHSSGFSETVVLKSEVSWNEKTPRVIQVPVDYNTLANAKCRVGLALRIGGFAGPFSTNDSAGTFLAGLAASLVAEAQTNRLAPCELQLDFDCAESKLDGYRLWLEAIRPRISPVPLTITVLPSWLNQSAFGRLIAASDGYVLQVHSLERPRDVNAPFTLCDPAAAQRAVERAGKFAVPFRLALPTYGYVIAFDSKGRFIGLSAEGQAKSWPNDVQTREVRANPVEMAGLVRFWNTNRPPAMRGIIWYRLPVTGDILNWRWPTLSAIISARSLRESFRAEQHRVESGLVEISLENDGELDISSRFAIEVRWPRECGARLVASDGLRGFESVGGEPFTVRFQNKLKPQQPLPGEKQVIGWLRFDRDCEVQVEIKKF